MEGEVNALPLGAVMSKIDRVIRLINLLIHRRCVTLETIQEVCGIPERTAYRYLNTISEANVPVYYDKKTRAYRLDRDRCIPISNLGIGDAVLVLVALLVLANKVNDHYRSDIQEIIKKLLGRNPFPMEDILKSFDNMIRSEDEARQDMSQLVSSVLIQAGVLSESEIQLVVDQDDEMPAIMRVEKPYLRFRKGWELVEKIETGGEGLSMASVKKVSIW
jgi:predicted DNA-binding transcriptional regulator YafY